MAKHVSRPKAYYERIIVHALLMLRVYLTSSIQALVQKATRRTDAV